MTNPSTKELLSHIDVLLGQSPNGDKLVLNLPIKYTWYIQAILDRWPKMVVITSSQIKEIGLSV
jgi:hypothetical protein